MEFHCNEIAILVIWKRNIDESYYLSIYNVFICFYGNDKFFSKFQTSKIPTYSLPNNFTSVYFILYTFIRRAASFRNEVKKFEISKNYVFSVKFRSVRKIDSFLSFFLSFSPGNFILLLTKIE